ncbi:hypothetical protein [Escherichia coli]|uniref:hypothetical protein n=1 Tax=Escherichia coli TaxID=562 RepID=UPI003EEBF46D
MSENSDTSIKYQKDIATLQRVCKRTLQSADYSTIVDKMREGPKVRGSDRKSYISKDGWQGDVYVFLLKAIASNPPTLTFRYSDLVSRVTSLCHGDSPSGSSINHHVSTQLLLPTMLQIAVLSSGIKKAMY